MIYSERYAKEIHKPAIPASMGDLCVFIGHIVVSVKPTLAIRAEPDYVALAETFGRGVRFKRLFGNK